MEILIVLLVVAILLLVGISATRRWLAGAPRRRLVRELIVAGFNPAMVRWALDPGHPSWVPGALLALPRNEGWSPTARAWEGAYLWAHRGCYTGGTGPEWLGWDTTARAWRRFTPPRVVETTPDTLCVAGVVVRRGVPCSDPAHPSPWSWCPCVTAGGYDCSDYRDIEVPAACTNHSPEQHQKVLPGKWE
jgi:hypothetical protein